ncbi:MAG: dihydrofolate reductase [Dermatophilaceae bacterium]|nr:dihydrofolate reductase [Dermatophilaceae bacterium]NUO92662.1 dihydrofolate reductase [Dermatophilaceae bacterium]NUQ31915.1 dihydrofolate reductase [Dermatophilaceae bacterium]NUR16080.1 dihydrofolate reductase [Dermatophilaceae bacterium]NUR79881.1 dihydrofolate reductase [Dermatophilaceae bacterium]
MTEVRPNVTMIAAVGRNGVIGDGETMPWHLPEDLKFFKRTTMGHPMVMGRRTFDSMGALPGRRSIVVTRSPDWSRDGVDVAHSLEEALDLVADDGEVFVVGGGEVYRLALPYAARLVITEVDRSPEGSVTFPQIDPEVWVETSREPRTGFDWVTYERSSGRPDGR